MINESYNPKHSPVIELKKEGDIYKISVEVGKEVKHPNESSHNIKWLDVFYHSESSVIHLIRVNFEAHGESGCIVDPKVEFYAKLSEDGEIVAITYCNLHGLWGSKVSIGSFSEESLEDKIVELLSKQNRPLKAQEISNLLRVDKKMVNRVLKRLKEDGKIKVVRRCYYELAN